VKRVQLASLLVLAGTGALFAPGATAVERPSHRSVDALEAKLLESLNSLRARRGLARLRLSHALSSAARQHSWDMARNGFCGHASGGGTSFWKRLMRFYGRGRVWRGWAVAENVLCHPRHLTASAALGRWLGSPGHRANLLSSDWRDVGLAAVYAGATFRESGGDDALFLTADFGFRY
jgi:uncharacterized protein YkwD